MSDPITLAQIEAEPEKWQVCTRYLWFGRWYAASSFRNSTPSPSTPSALFARPIGTTQPYRKVEE